MPSDQEATIFGQDPSTSNEEGITDTGTQTTETVIPELAKDLIGEGRKYKDVEAALNSIPHADNHIKTLEAELDDLRKKDGEGKTVEDILETLSNQTNEDASKTPEVNEADIADKVAQILTQTATKEQQKINIRQASEGLTNLAGNNDTAVEMLRNKASSMGVDTDDLMVIASKSPEGFLQLFAEGTASGGDSYSQPSQGTINTSTLKPDAASQGSHSWWMAQKKERGATWYYSPEASNQRLKDADRLGRESFFKS